ncbi:MAG: ATP synthase F1 subunit gamma [Actinobacteria bacterium]|nr:ATP synthase F1 subunit gamma [Actinomycetota bacterium]
MASQKDLRQSIASVENTRKITKAMEMVAAARLRRSQQRIEQARPYAHWMMEFIAGLVRYAPTSGTGLPLLEPRMDTKRVAVLAFTADRGLCGAFNANVVRRTLELKRTYEAQDVEVDLHVVGRKGVSTFRFQGYHLVGVYTGITDRPRYLNAQTIADVLIRAYSVQDVDAVHLVYNRFKTAMEQNLIDEVILPIQEEVVTKYASDVVAPHMEFIFEPGPGKILRDLLPTYVEMAVFSALLESSASEHGARMTAMRNASDSAIDMINSLNLAMNRARQASITQEILEVVAGADALA